MHFLQKNKIININNKNRKILQRNVINYVCDMKQIKCVNLIKII